MPGDRWEDYYIALRTLPDGTVIGVQTMLFTTALVFGIDATGYKTRFCYDGPNQLENALNALNSWGGAGWPPGYWLKQKPEGTINPARQNEH